MLSRLLSPNQLTLIGYISQITRKVGQCLDGVPSSDSIHTDIFIHTKYIQTHTQARARICKSYLKCITFGPIVCLGVAFRANFIPGKVEVAQLTSMQMAKEGVRRALLCIYLYILYRKWRSPRQNGNTMSSNVLVSQPDAWNYENDLRNMEQMHKLVKPQIEGRRGLLRIF